jgi:hypothetical protein
LNANKGETASGSQALSSRGSEAGNSEQIDRIVIKKHIKPTGYRYVGPGEAAEATSTGYAPNTNVRGDPKPVFYTPDEGLNSATQAQKMYKIPNTPTHRIGLDTTRVTNIYGGNGQGIEGIEMITNDNVPVVDIHKLNK